MAANEIRDAALHYIAAANLPSGAAATEDMLPDGARAQATAGALATYSRLFPREISVAVAGPGATILDLSTLAGWSEGVSLLIEIEYPYTAATLGENLLHGDAWRVVDDPTNGKTLVFLEDTPAASAQVRYKFTGTHVDTDPTSVRATHVDAVAKIAAANMAHTLASRTAAHKEITVGASISPNATQAAYRDLARSLRKTALDDLGVGGDSGDDAGGAPGTAVQTIDLDDYSSHGYGRLTHRRRRRY